MSHKCATRVISVLCALAFIFDPSGLGARAQQKRLLQLDDLFGVRQIVELELSPSGSEILYALQEANLNENRYVKTLWRLPTTGQAQPSRLTDSDKDYSPRWSPHGKTVAFLSARAGLPQIWLLDIATGKLDKISDSPTGVLSFKWSPDGQYLAYLSQDEGKESFERAIQNKDRGVIIKKETFVIYQLLRNQLFLDRDKNSHLFLLNLSSLQTTQLSGVKHVEEFAWSSDSRALALTTKPGRGDKWSSDIITYFLEKGRSQVVLRGEQGDDWDQMANYTSPIWSPDGTQLTVLYENRKDRWSSVQQVGVYSFQSGKLTLITKQTDLEPYLAKFYWSEKDNIYFENTSKGSRGLFRLSPMNGNVRSVVSSGGCDEQFSFSRDSQKVAYVHQTSQEPPEVYISNFPFNMQRKLTSLNDRFDNIQLPTTERVKWTAPDGIQVEGTLFKPTVYATGRAYPLLVFVHGGPTIAIENRFEPYSLGPVWLWPYPFRLFANRGYAVFLPDYRGTASYGKSFRETRDPLKSPSADIMSGIYFLIKKGIADPNSIGIMGQSYGAWLGPNVMAHNRIFKAASFAEGFADMASLYGQVSGRVNLNVHDYYYGDSAYDNPKRYIELSPIFNLKGLNTATLLEFGEQSLAVQGLEFQSALWRQGVPNELVIYPKTGHNISSPVLMLESINRNLDWFDYWMLGRRDPASAKEEQYARWEKMAKEMAKMRERNSSAKSRKRYKMNSLPKTAVRHQQ
jgi:dipeptidyl aminopeptidase/acylaminoacyl peptidase